MGKLELKVDCIVNDANSFLIEFDLLDKTLKNCKEEVKRLVSRIRFERLMFVILAFID